jgi:hypothetical protein
LDVRFEGCAVQLVAISVSAEWKLAEERLEKKKSRQKWVQLKKNPARREIGKPGYNEADELARSRGVVSRSESSDPYERTNLQESVRNFGSEIPRESIGQR